MAMILMSPEIGTPELILSVGLTEGLAMAYRKLNLQERAKLRKVVTQLIIAVLEQKEICQAKSIKGDGPKASPGARRDQ